jgi:hypothetical protein
MNNQLTKSQAVDAAVNTTINQTKKGGLRLSLAQETRLRLEISYALHNRRGSSKITISRTHKKTKSI